MCRKERRNKYERWEGEKGSELIKRFNKDDTKCSHMNNFTLQKHCALRCLKQTVHLQTYWNVNFKGLACIIQNKTQRKWCFQIVNIYSSKTALEMAPVLYDQYVDIKK